MTNTIKQRLIKDRMINKLLNKIEDDLKKYPCIDFYYKEHIYDYINSIIFDDYIQLDVPMHASATKEMFKALYSKYHTRTFLNRNNDFTEIIYKREVF